MPKTQAIMEGDEELKNDQDEPEAEEEYYSNNDNNMDQAESPVQQHR